MIRADRAILSELTLEILSVARHLDLEAGEADIAFRSAGSLTGDTLVATRLPAIMWTVYCAETYRDGGSGPTGAGVSPKMVDHHVSAILGKLGASTRGEAEVLARESGWLSATASSVTGTDGKDWKPADGVSL